MYSAEEGAVVLTKDSMLSVAGLARISMRSRFALVGATLDGFAKHFFSEQRTESCAEVHHADDETLSVGPIVKTTCTKRFGV